MFISKHEKQTFAGCYVESENFLEIHSWSFEKRSDSRYICSRWSGAHDYIAEWWLLDGKYQLKCICYDESDRFNVLEHGILQHEVDTIQDVLMYCCSRYHVNQIKCCR
jgi:hypothetical protein